MSLAPGICRNPGGKAAHRNDEHHAGRPYRSGPRYGTSPAARPALATPYASGRTTARIGMEPAPAIVTFRPGRGACTIAPSPMYMATWLASLK